MKGSITAVVEETNAKRLSQKQNKSSVRKTRADKTQDGYHFDMDMFKGESFTRFHVLEFSKGKA